MPANSSTYNREYHKKNRGEINAGRRKKYMQNKTHADQHRQRSKENMRRKRKRDREARAENPEKSVRRRSGPRRYEIPVGGQWVKVRCYHIGGLATRLERVPTTIRKWEQSGVLPEPMFRDSANRRLYTADQVNALVRAYRKTMKEVQGQGHKWLPALRAAFHIAWAELPRGVKEDDHAQE